MPDSTPIAVTSRSFSRHPILREELLARYDNVRFNDDGTQLKGDALAAFAAGRIKLITALETIDEAFLSSAPNLQVISKYGVGVDMIDMDAMVRHGVRLGWTGGVNRRSVAELTLGFMISLLHLVPQCDRDLRNGVWQNRKGRQLSDRIVGIVGCGHVGKELVGLLQGFGCRILVNDICADPDFYTRTGVKPVSLEVLLATADVVTLHVPLDESTRNIMSAQRLQMMQPGSILINAARGGLVDEQALADALASGRIAGAAFDVFAEEPPTDWTLVRQPNVLATPHIGGSTDEAILAMGRSAIDGLDRHWLPVPGQRPTG